MEETNGEIIAVYDLGGGTFDISILNISYIVMKFNLQMMILHEVEKISMWNYNNNLLKNLKHILVLIFQNKMAV